MHFQILTPPQTNPKFEYRNPYCSQGVSRKQILNPKFESPKRVFAFWSQQLCSSKKPSNGRHSKKLQMQGAHLSSSRQAPSLQAARRHLEE
jgi:hypothetical protein